MDNDILCEGLGRVWAKPYGFLCQWSLDANVIVYFTLSSLKKQLGRYGNRPHVVIKHQSQRYDFLSSQPLFLQSINMTHEIQQIDTLIRNSDSNKEGLNLAREVCLSRLRDVRQMRVSNNHHYDMTRSYLERVYDAKYEQAILEARVHLNDVPSGILGPRLKLLRPQVMRGIEEFAEQLIQHGDVKKLRLAKPDKAIRDGYLDENIRLN